MSDENMNNNEETAALFVSTQRKKQAEEEARKKAEEEKARREAAEAEVRRMEQEVEERKRKAEEEKRALEEQKRAMEEEEKKLRSKKAQDEEKKAKEDEKLREEKEKKLQAAKEEKEAKLAEKQKAKAEKAGDAEVNRMPIFIGIGAAAVIVIVLIVVFALRGGGKTDYSGLEFNSEYTPAAEDFDIPINYPDKLYPEVSEASQDDSIEISFVPKKEDDVHSFVRISTVRSKDDGEAVDFRNVAFLNYEEWSDVLYDGADEGLKSFFSGGEITDEYVAEYQDKNPGAYMYSCTFHTEEYENGKGAGWIECNSEGVYNVVFVASAKAKTDDEAVTRVNDLFTTYNTEEAFMMPGAVPPSSTEADGAIELEEAHLGLPVPDDLFTLYGKSTNYDAYTDLNGAMIFLSAVETDIDLVNDADNYDTEKLLAALQEGGDSGITDYLSDVDDRSLLDENYVNDNKFQYIGDYKTVRKGVSYWERYYAFYWTDLTTGLHYFIVVNTMAPEVNMDEYMEIFENMIANYYDT